MKRFWTMAALTLVVGTAGLSMANAQETQPPRRPAGGFQGRPGGFGGGFGGPTTVIGMATVQKELELTDDQKSKLEGILKDARGNAADFASLRDLKQEEREKKMEELRKAGAERSAKAAKAIKDLLNDKQNARLEQLVVQQMGTRALTRDEVASKLGLTEEQKEKITKIRSSAFPMPGAGGARPAPGGDFRERAAKLDKEILAVLSEDQQKKFDELKGPKFEFPAFGGFPGAGGGNTPTRRPGARPGTESQPKKTDN